MNNKYFRHTGSISRRTALKLLGVSLTGVIIASAPVLAFSTTNRYIIPTRGIYVPGWKGVNRYRIDILMDFMIENNLNTLMIDLKDAHGDLFYEPELELAQKIGAQTTTISGQHRSIYLDYLIESTYKNSIRLIGRHVMFSDKKLYNQMPEFRLKRGHKQYWVDMENAQVIDYNMELIRQESKMGFNEIVLDYIRFPDLQGFGTEDNRCNTIDTIVKMVNDILKEAGVGLGLQIFGYSAWSHNSSNVGQRIETLQLYADTLYPMLYPSHFHKGTLGYEDPNRYPFEIISSGYEAAISKITTNCHIIPMLQSFSYSPENISKQIMAVHSLHMPGYICWNPSGNYSKLSQALKLNQ